MTDFNRMTEPHPGFKGAENPRPGQPLATDINTSIPMHVHPGALSIDEIVKPLTLSDGQTPDGILITARDAHKRLYEAWGKLNELRKSAGGQTIEPGLETEYIAAVNRIATPADAAFASLGRTLLAAIDHQQGLINAALVDKQSRPELQAEIRAMIRSASKPNSATAVRHGDCFSRIQTLGLPGVAAALAVEHCPQLAGLDADKMQALRTWGEKQYAAPLLARRHALEIIANNHTESLGVYRAFVEKQRNIKISAQTKAVRKLREIV